MSSAFTLSEEENEDIFRTVIVPRMFGESSPRRLPTVFILGGQPGVGKSTLVEHLRPRFQRHGGVVVVDRDELRERHPQFADIQALGAASSAQHTDADSLAWTIKAISYARTQKLNVIIEGTMRDPTVALRTAAQFRAAGFRVGAAIVTGHPSRSRQQILSRFVTESERGRGRYVPTEVHDAACAGVIVTAGALEETAAVDEIEVYRADGHVVYRNVLDPAAGAWTLPPRAAAVTATEQQRPPRGLQVTRHFRALRRCATELHTQHVDEMAWDTEILDIAAAVPHAVPTPMAEQPLHVADDTVNRILEQRFQRAGRVAHVVGSLTVSGGSRQATPVSPIATSLRSVASPPGHSTSTIPATEQRRGFSSGRGAYRPTGVVAATGVSVAAMTGTGRTSLARLSRAA